jgi:hypothetical protein
MRPYSIAVTPRSSRDPMTRHLPTDTGPAAVHHAAQTDHAILALHLKSGERCCNGRDRVPTGAAFPLRAQTALSQQPPPEHNVHVNCDGTVIESWRRACLRFRNHVLHVVCLNRFNVHQPYLVLLFDRRRLSLPSQARRAAHWPRQAPLAGAFATRGADAQEETDHRCRHIDNANPAERRTDETHRAMVEGNR